MDCSVGWELTLLCIPQLLIFFSYLLRGFVFLRVKPCIQTAGFFFFTEV